MYLVELYQCHNALNWTNWIRQKSNWRKLQIHQKRKHKTPLPWYNYLDLSWRVDTNQINKTSCLSSKELNDNWRNACFFSVSLAWRNCPGKQTCTFSMSHNRANILIVSSLYLRWTIYDPNDVPLWIWPCALSAGFWLAEIPDAVNRISLIGWGWVRLHRQRDRQKKTNRMREMLEAGDSWE